MFKKSFKSFFYKFYKLFLFGKLLLKKSPEEHTMFINFVFRGIKMVRVWYLDNLDADQRLEHQKTPLELIQIGELYEKTGVEYYSVNPVHYVTDAKLNKIRQDRGYSYEDEVTLSDECLPNYEAQLKNFFTEHLHKDEEIRLVLDGSGYFDVRDGLDQWIRIEAVAGDMVIMPSGMYHRFTLDKHNYIKAKRYFVGDPVWKAYYRPADEMDCRHEYMHKMMDGFKETEVY